MLNLIIIIIYQYVILNILNFLLKNAQIRRISNINKSPILHTISTKLEQCIRISLSLR